MKTNFLVKCILKLCILPLLLLTSTSSSLSQTIGQKFKMEITPDTKKFPIFELPNVSSAMLSVVRNDDTVKVLQKDQNWIRITLPSGKTGWVKYSASDKVWDSNINGYVSWTWKFIPLGSKNINVSPSQPIINAQDINARLTMLENKVIELEAMVMKLTSGASSTSVAPSLPAKPTEDEIKMAVTNHLKHNVPITWAGNLMGGKNAQLSVIQVIKVGNYNQQQKYWPMRIKCVGRCEMNDMFNQGKWNSFDRVGEFILFQDDYGNWKAQMKEGLFQ